MMLAFIEVMKSQSGQNYKALFPETIHDVFQKKGLSYFKLRTLFIDDMCREPEKVQHFGRSINPVREITMYRNRFSNQNYATANFQVYKNGKLQIRNELITRYGTMVFDRLKEMYNFLELTGKSRR